MFSTTVIVQLAAESAGSASTPDVANTTPAVRAATFSFERLTTVAFRPQGEVRRWSRVKLLTEPELFNAEHGRFELGG
ncbi:MAG: hypothetical protein JO168_20145 [Solirubrobacterales bacterium]|nr:hypothetical protein [Solirubrobacterales bacterium]